MSPQLHWHVDAIYCIGPSFLGTPHPYRYLQVLPPTCISRSVSAMATTLPPSRDPCATVTEHCTCGRSACILPRHGRSRSYVFPPQPRPARLFFSSCGQQSRPLTRHITYPTYQSHPHPVLSISYHHPSVISRPNSTCFTHHVLETEKDQEQGRAPPRGDPRALDDADADEPEPRRRRPPPAHGAAHRPARPPSVRPTAPGADPRARARRVMYADGLALPKTMAVPAAVQAALASQQAKVAQAVSPSSVTQQRLAHKSRGNRDSVQRAQCWWLPYLVMDFDVNQVVITPLGGDLVRPVYMYQAQLCVRPLNCEQRWTLMERAQRRVAPLGDLDPGVPAQGGAEAREQRRHGRDGPADRRGQVHAGLRRAGPRRAVARHRRRRRPPAGRGAVRAERGPPAHDRRL